MIPHLDAERWAALLEGRLPKEEATALSEHLEQGCALCEAFLAEREEADALDGYVDEALLDVGPRGEARPDDVGFARVRRGLRSRPRGLVVALGGIAALAAAVLLVVLVPEEEGQRLKGPAEVPSLGLEVLRTAPGVPPEPLAKGATVESRTLLVFRVHLDRPACVQLWEQDDGLKPLLHRPECLDAGTHVLSHRGQTLGLPLGAAGEVVLWLTPAEHPEAVRRDLATGTAPQGSDRFPLHVIESRR